MQPLKSVEQGAGILGVSKWTARKWIREGKLKAVRLGRRVLIEEAELERFVAAGKQEAIERASDRGNHEQL